MSAALLLRCVLRCSGDIYSSSASCPRTSRRRISQAEGTRHELETHTRARYSGRKIRLRDRSGVRLHVGAEDSGSLGLDHLRLLLGRLRDVHRREGWPGGQRSGQSRSPGKSRQALPQGTLRTLHDWSRKPRQVSAAAEERQVGASELGRSAQHHDRRVSRGRKPSMDRMRWA